MSMISLHNPSALESLLERKEHQRPSLLLIRSDNCPPCEALHPQITALALRTQGIDFYEFNVDHCAAPQLDAQLTRLFLHWGVKYLPSQVFLATGLVPAVISSRRVDVIERRLRSMADSGPSHRQNA